MAKHVRLAAAFAAFMVLFFACSRQQAGQAGSSGAQGDGVTPRGVFPIVNEPYTLTVAMRLHPNVEDIKTNYFTRHLEKVTGVSINPIVLPENENDALTTVNLMFASGDLPDVVAGVLNISSSVINEFALSGQLVPINEYIDKYGIGLQSNKARMPPEEAAMVDSILTMPDGKIYSMPSITTMPTDKYSMMTWVYKPWLEALKLQPPKTLDDFYNMCVAFKTRDPNGNGIADEIPISNSKPQANRIVSYIGNAFQYTDWEWYLKVTNGKVESNTNNAEYRKTLEYVRKLMADGLLDPLMFTQSNAELKATLAVDKVIVGVIPYASPSGYLNSSQEPMRSYDIIDMVEGPNGFKSTVSRGSQIFHDWLITKNCKLPAVAFRVADYCFSDAGWNYLRYGEKGVDWDDPTGTDILGQPASIRLINDVYGLPSQNKIWRNHILYFYDVRYLQRQNDAKDFKEYEAKKYIASQMLMKSAPPEAVPMNLKYPSVDDEGTIVRLRTELRSYIEEMQALFIMGDVPLNDTEWNRYVNELNNRGLQTYVSTVQKAYDNTVGKK
ncbi:ABC transporter substrate-binding protein [Spirochaetia bacterium]|nr:ABC transporter substrate-binding protein [Spirochaetia bacterium]